MVSATWGCLFIKLSHVSEVLVSMVNVNWETIKKRQKKSIFNRLANRCELQYKIFSLKHILLSELNVDH